MVKYTLRVLEETDRVDDGNTELLLTLEVVRWLLKLGSRDDAKIAAGLSQ